MASNPVTHRKWFSTMHSVSHTPLHGRAPYERGLKYGLYVRSRRTMIGFYELDMSLCLYEYVRHGRT
jgi:hypothetical protein